MSGDAAARAVEAFSAAFRRAPEIAARAPGRVNLIGEHTDYNDGFVLPCAIGLGTSVAAAARDDGVVRVLAADFSGATDRFTIDAPIERSRDNPWANYIRGVVEGMRREGFAFTGGDLAIAGDVPKGAGLSSSASLEVAVALAVATLSGRPDADRKLLAKIAQRAENDFAGCRCGVMDQLAASCGVAGAALLIDCRSLEVRPVAVPDAVAILIVHSGVVHHHGEGEYNVRRRQCDAAAAIIGAPTLRDATLAALESRSGALDGVLARRARHVITENARTLAAAAALAAGDLRSLGALMRASHRSMRDDFEITTPDIDRLAGALNALIGEEGGARMTGGGFGGAVAAVVPAARARDIGRAIEARYNRPDGLPTLALIERPADGARVRRRCD